MKRHPVTFETLADWVDGKLTTDEHARVELHLASGCSKCQSDIEWLQRFRESARSSAMVEPPSELVAQAKGIYRKPVAVSHPRRAWWIWTPRLGRLLAAGMAAAIVLAFATSQVPTVLANSAIVTSVSGLLERATTADGGWSPIRAGEHLAEQSRIRAAGGTAVVTLFDGSILTLEPGAEVSLASLRSGLFRGSACICVEQESGVVRYEVTVAHGLTSSFRARSGATQVVVTGTSFELSVDDSDNTQVTVISGRVRVESPQGDADLEERESAMVNAGSGPTLLPTLTATPTATPTAKPSERGHSATPIESGHRDGIASPSATANRPSPSRTATPERTEESTGSGEPRSASPSPSSRPTSDDGHPEASTEPSRTAAPSATPRPTEADHAPTASPTRATPERTASGTPRPTETSRAQRTTTPTTQAAHYESEPTEIELGDGHEARPTPK